MEIQSDFFEITTPVESKDAKLFAKIINQGIDSNLEGFTKSKFDTKQTSNGRRLVLNFHKDEIPTLVRRLEEIGTEEALMWADDIKNYKEEESLSESRIVNKKNLSKEYERSAKITNRVEERLNEGMFDATSGTEMTRGGAVPKPYVSRYNPQAGMNHYPGFGKTVNTFMPTMDAQHYGVSANLTSTEALSIAIKRVVKSGAPVNNMDFYQEVNWNLNNMGFDSAQPMDIKEGLKKMLKDK
jgi:hypothetical protein